MKSLFPETRDTTLYVIDLQEKLLGAFDEKVRERLIARSAMLVKYFAMQQLPIVVFEQYPKGMGATVAPVKDVLGDAYKPVEKTCFNAMLADGAPLTNRGNVVLIGAETHICVLQTCIDLIGAGKHVFVPADGVASRFKVDWRTGLSLMERAGAMTVTAEALLFTWLGKAGTPEFKAMLPYVK